MYVIYRTRLNKRCNFVPSNEEKIIIEKMKRKDNVILKRGGLK
jgi:hypothetical protein